MQTILKLNHQEYAVELSGNELETLTKILKKTALADLTSIDAIEVIIPGEPLKYEIKVVSAVQMTQAQADDLRARVQIKRRTKVFADKNWKEMLSQLYYDDIIAYKDREAFEYRGTDYTAEGTDFALFTSTAGGPYIRVYADGRVERVEA